MLHGTYNGTGQPRCPTCRVELQDPVDAMQSQLLDERRQWRLQLAEERSRHEREMTTARRQWEETYNRFEQRVYNELARAYLDQVHFSRALLSSSKELFQDAIEQIEHDCRRENIRPERLPQASAMYVRLRNKYERFDWTSSEARGEQPAPPPLQGQVQPPPPPPEQEQPAPLPPQFQVQTQEQQPPAPPSPLRAFVDAHTQRARAGGVGGARMAVESRRHANPYPLWTTKMRSRRDLY